MDEFVYVDPNEGTPPSDVLRQPRDKVTYVLPPGTGWAEFLHRHLSKNGFHVRWSNEYFTVNGLNLPLRPPWIDLREIRLFRHGGMSKLYRALHRCGSFTYIIKSIDREMLQMLGMHEIILSKKRLPALFPVIDIARTEESILLLMPEAQRQLDIHIDPIEDVIPRIAQGIRELHTLGWVHADIKPANILYYLGKFYLCDTGISMPEGTTLSRLRCSLRYAPPEWFDEYMTHHRVTIRHSADIYALTMLTLVCTAGSHPFDGIPEDQIYLEYALGGFEQRIARFLEKYPENLGAFFLNGLSSQWERRPSIDEWLETFNELKDTFTSLSPHESRKAESSSSSSQTTPLENEDGIHNLPS